MSEQPIPPGNLSRLTGMHWLKMRRNDSDPFDQLIALQWNPGSKTWTHSQGHSTSKGGLNCEGYSYVEAIKYPEL